ncbi:ABC transporter ATP-binding protein [Pseudoroseicyclus tamaricis]|uniref:ABC transporter ATP-binding protein n=1 Tax=Pseudoroseicyclus tamaricis TaxID=2705421 RepID=A0A6B2JTX2_9RHOB|nr:ABC transporter ATP-binding protein [Pseudoroseicyclus tamaricis]NDV00049.1 ABC transporter ATP-binding protein [Pseudoroseicyclus tamaricis]
MTETLLSVEDLKVHFPLASGDVVHAVDGVTFDVARGACFGIVGESGSGKSTVARALMRLEDPTEGRITLGTDEISSLSGDRLRALRHRFQMIFQDPYSSLNPRLRAGQAVREPLDLMGLDIKGGREQWVRQCFADVGLHPDSTRLFPHQFSGGQRQRLSIARALATQPSLIVCDEPVSALDVAIQAQILNLLRRIQREKFLTFVFISHDLAVVQNICTEVAVMYLGEFVERAPTGQLYAAAKHPYTWSLMAAALTPENSRRAGERFTITGEPPSPIDPPKGCRFAGRCPFATDTCVAEKPAIRDFGGGHTVACHYAGELTPPLEELAA